MNPFDYGPALAKSFAALWSGDSDGFLRAQQEAGRTFTEGLKAMAGSVAPEAAPAANAGATTDMGADMARAAEAVGQLWAAAAQMATSLATRLHNPGTDPASPMESMTRHMLDPTAWLAAGTGDLADTLGRVADGPRFADLWDNERRYARVMAAWVSVRRTALEHNAVTLEAWMRAGRTFSDTLAKRGDRPDAKAALALWTDIANAELLETQRSPAFLASQAAAIRANTELRLAQQTLVEQAGKQFGFPSRTELDDVHRTVTELRRELRRMQRELRVRHAEPPPPAPAPIVPPAPIAAAPQPARRKPGRRTA